MCSVYGSDDDDIRYIVGITWSGAVVATQRGTTEAATIQGEALQSNRMYYTYVSSYASSHMNEVLQPASLLLSAINE